LRETIMIGVTSVNDCRYCRWGHSPWAMLRGVPLKEVNQNLCQQTGTLKAQDPTEAEAILLAQYYAENLDPIDLEAMEDLRKSRSAA
jgi:AhpD family alkylhydroperoxidase